MAHDVFISYSSQDKAVADAVCATLESRKIRCWIAPRDVLPGQPYAESILEGINRSRIFVLVFSSDSNLSQQVLREVERAVSKSIPILPFRIENVEPTKSMELFLSATHWLDALTPPIEQYLQKLADSVEVILGTGAPPKTEAEPPVKVEKKGGAGKGKIKPVYIIGGIVVAVIVILAIFLTRGGDEDQDGLTSNLTSTKPAVTSTSTPKVTPTTTPGTAKPTVTSTPTPAPTSTPTPTVTPVVTSTPTTTATGNTPGVVTPGTSLKGELTFNGEVHWYSFNAQAGDSVYIVLVEGIKSNPMYPWLGLLDPDGGVVYEDYSSEYVQIDRKLTKTGKYTIRVRDHNIGTGPYVLSFSQLSQTSNPISLGSTQNQLTFNGEVHWYTFDAEAGDSVYIVLAEGTKSSPMYPWLGLLDPDGGVVYEDYSSEYVQIDRKLTKTGKYTIRVRDHNIGTGPYVLSFSQLSKTSNPISPGASIQGQLKFPGEVIWYTFDGKAGDSVYIVLMEGTKSSPMYPWLGLLDPDGGVVYEDYSSESVQIDRALAKTGKYIIRVRDHSIGTGPYVLSFNMLVKS